MILTSRNLVFYLAERGLLPFEAVVDGDVVVVESPSRNRNFKVIRRRGPGFFVKQIKEWGPQEVATLQREARCYQLAQSEAPFAELAPLLPRFYAFDPARNVLVVELLPEAESLAAYHRRTGEFPLAMAATLGRMLGAYHRQPVEAASGSAAGIFPRLTPWVLSLHEQRTLPGLSGANAELLQVVRQYPEFGRALEALRSQWRAERLVHGDIKWDNCVLYAGADGTSALKVVDWEMADIGDPLWDVGAIFQAYLAFWVMSMQIGRDTPAEQLVERAQFPLEQMQPAIRTFWSAYRATRELDTRESGELLRRAVQYGAARLIQTTYESMYSLPQITPTALYMLQVSMNVLTRPADAVRDLLGM